MFCVRCQQDVVCCTCPDIEDRLRALCRSVNSAGAIAAAANLQARSLARELNRPRPLAVLD